MTHQTLTISRLAASAKVNIETVRYYQRRGLLNEPARPLGGICRTVDMKWPADLLTNKSIYKAKAS